MIMRRTGPICGRAKRTRTKSPNLIGPRSFRTKSSTMKVIFNHAYVAELVASLLNTKNRPSFLKLSVAFTAFKFDEKCDDINSDSIEDSSESWRHCGSICVHGSTFCNNVLNCDDFSDELIDCVSNSTGTSAGNSSSEIFFDNSDETDDSGEDSDENQMFIRYSTDNLNSRYPEPSDSFYPSTSRLPTRSPTVPSYPRSPMFTNRNSRYEYSRNKFSTTEKSVASSVVPKNNNNREVATSLDYENSAVIEHNVYTNNNMDTSDSIMLSHPVSRELSSFLHTLVYGVSIFILFLVCATIIGVCAGKKCYVTWCKYRQSHSSGTSRGVNNNFTPTVVVVTNGNNGSSINSVNVAAEESPPSYDSLYPVPA